MERVGICLEALNSVVWKHGLVLDSTMSDHLTWHQNAHYFGSDIFWLCSIFFSTSGTHKQSNWPIWTKAISCLHFAREIKFSRDTRRDSNNMHHLFDAVSGQQRNLFCRCSGSAVKQFQAFLEQLRDIAPFCYLFRTLTDGQRHGD